METPMETPKKTTFVALTSGAVLNFDDVEVAFTEDDKAIIIINSDKEHIAVIRMKFLIGWWIANASDHPKRRPASHNETDRRMN